MMKNIKTLSLFTGALLFLSASNSFSQNSQKSKFFKAQPPVVNTIPTAQPTQSAFSQDELKQIFGDGAPRPGIYSIRALNSGLCLGSSFTSRALSGAFVNRIITGSCAAPDAVPPNASFAVIPNPLGGYTIRSLSSWNVPNTPNLNVGAYEQCATISRGVVFGPAAIIFQKCEMPPNATQFSQIGTDDQRVTFEVVSKKIFIIHTNNGECWDVQNQSLNPNTDIIRWGCTGNPNQKFEFNYIGPITDQTIENNLGAQGYYKSIVDGRWRMKYTPNISFTGTPYSSSETKKDNGLECSNWCLNEKRCVNWVYNASDPAINPICSLRDNFSSPIRYQGSIGGSIRH